MITRSFEPASPMPVAAIAAAHRHHATSPVYGTTVARLAEVSRSVLRQATSSAPATATATAPGIQRINPRILPVHRSNVRNAL
jgi:hypothetical protein